MKLKVADLFKVSLEEIQDEQVPDVAYNDELVEDTDAVVAELAEAHDDVTEAVEEAQELEDTAEHLEVTITIATESLSTGGLDAASAAEFRASIGRIYAKVGLSVQTMPSLEAHSGDSLTYTQEAINDVRAKLKAFWETLKKVLKEAWARVTKFFGQLFDATVQLEKHAAAVYKLAKSTKGSVNGKIAVVNPGVASFRGKSDLDSLGKGLSATAIVYDKAVSAAVTAYANAAAPEAFADAVKDPVLAFSTHGRIKFDGGVVVGGDVDRDGLFGIKFVKKESGDSEIAAPSPVVIAAYAHNVINFCKAIRSSKAEIDKLGKDKEAFLEAAANKTNSEAALTKLKVYNRAVDLDQKKREHVLTAIAKVGIQAAAAGLKTAERSLKAHKVKEAPKALPAPAAA